MFVACCFAEFHSFVPSPMIPQATAPTCSQKRRFNQQCRRQVASSSNPNTSDGHLQLELLIQDLDKESRSLTFGHESLCAEDLRRFMDGWANDEVINMFVSVLDHSHQPAVHSHFASAFGVGLPSCNVKIMSTFFYPKLCKVLQARKDADGSAQTIERELVRWFKTVSFIYY
jgi:Ulp1 family protease